MTARLKVYGGHGNPQREGDNYYVQPRYIVAATSKKKAAELCNISLHHLSTYWSETGNPNEMATALAEPGVVFWVPDEEDRSPHPKNWRRFDNG